MSESQFRWEDFYQNASTREPRDLLMRVLRRFQREATGRTRRAIDLGCGDGAETAAMLAQGWEVLAIDGEPVAFEHLQARTSDEYHGRLQMRVASFEGLRLAPAELIYAGYSLPFCSPHSFGALWEEIVKNVRPGGRFAGQLFGVRDTWASNPEMTFVDDDGARDLLSEFEIESFDEEDEDGASRVGPKHWHVFHVVARKPSTNF